MVKLEVFVVFWNLKIISGWGVNNKGIQVIHHRAADTQWKIERNASVWKMRNLVTAANFGEDDDLDYDEASSSVLNKLSKSNYQSTRHYIGLSRAGSGGGGRGGDGSGGSSTQTKSSAYGQRQIKIFLKNITVYTGDLARLHCPYAHPDLLSFSSHNAEQYLSTKTVFFYAHNFITFIN